MLDPFQLITQVAECAKAGNFDADLRLAYIALIIDEFTAASAGDYGTAQTHYAQAAVIGALMVQQHAAAMAANRPAPVIIGAAKE